MNFIGNSRLNVFLWQLMKTVSIIGTGNVASHLATSLFSKGVHIHRVFGRQKKSGEELAKLCNSHFVSDWNAFDTVGVDVVLIAVNDDQIENVSAHLKIGQAIIAHTSGTVDMNVLERHSKTGVFYPLQTFSKENEIDVSVVPFCIEGSTTIVETELTDLAKALSHDVRLVNSETRKLIHLAAVFACNFTNHMWAISNQILEETNQDLTILKPLITETITKAFNSSPKEAQTGPASRNDQRVMKKQLESLQGNTLFQSIYSDVSESIKKMKNE